MYFRKSRFSFVFSACCTSIVVSAEAFSLQRRRGVRHRGVEGNWKRDT
jgi:hypothetical protein